MKTKSHLLSVLFVLVALVVSAQGAGSIHQVTIEPSDKEGELQIGVTHTLWIPDGVKTVRGIIVHQHGCGEGACKSGEAGAYDLHWQELASKWDCALLSPRYHQAQSQNCRLWCDPRHGSGKVFEGALKTLASQSGHPEVATVPWCLWGHSGGGFWSSLMQMIYPERIVAIWFQSGTAHSRWVSGEIDAPKISKEAMRIPMVANPGFKERGHQRFKVAYSGCYEMVKDYRKRGAPIAFTPDPLSGHETRDSRYLSIPFFDECLRKRLPSKAGSAKLKQIKINKGTLTPLHKNYTGVTELAPVKKGEQETTNWLPSKDLAEKWAEFIQKGLVGDSTPPPAPTNVKSKNGLITWNARADFESGIQAFLIIKNGKEIGRVPAKSKSSFGRPLFQGNTYHDTPAPERPEMKFEDKDTTPGSYEVIAINSTGLRSDR